MLSLILGAGSMIPCGPFHLQENSLMRSLAHVNFYLEFRIREKLGRTNLKLFQKSPPSHSFLPRLAKTKCGPGFYQLQLVILTCVLSNWQCFRSFPHPFQLLFGLSWEPRIGREQEILPSKVCPAALGHAWITGVASCCRCTFSTSSESWQR